MYCKNLLKRQRKNKPYFYCKEFKREIILPCDKNCLKRNVVRNKPIRKVSAKRMKLEKERDKDLVKKGKCEYCKKYCDRLDPHEVYGGSNRTRSIKNGFVALICRECHENPDVIQELKKQYQAKYEYTHSREEFIDLIGKSFL